MLKTFVGSPKGDSKLRPAAIPTVLTKEHERYNSADVTGAKDMAILKLQKNLNCARVRTH